MRAFRTTSALLLLAVGCSDDPMMVLDAGAGVGARFDPEGADPLAYGAVPFPSDLYLDGEGRPRIGEFLHQDDDPRLVAIRDMLGARTGFCGTCNTYFLVDGMLDAATVPASAAPGDEASAGDAIVLADVDPASPERGRLYPLRVEHDAPRGVLAVRPVRGLALRRGRSYAVALTDAIAAADGTALAPSPAFLAVRDATSGGSPAVVRARDVLGPGLDVLDELGVGRGRIVAATVFTVGDPTAELVRARELVHAAPVPVATVDRVWSTSAELDELLGVPSEDRPGIDLVPADGTEGTRAMRHASVAVVVAGRFEAPRLLEGTGTEIGAPLRDAEGRLAAGEQQSVPFVLIVPSGADVSALPVVVHHHGFSASRTTGFVLADTTGNAGAAVLSIDGFQHGDRAHVTRDDLHNMRDSSGSDGFAETDMLAVTARVFGVTGTPEGMELYPGYPLGAFLQFDADVMAAIRLVHEGDVSAVAAAAPALASLAFDPERVLYAGNSMGAVVGAGVLAAESDVVAYALNVQPGSMVETLAESGEFRPLSETVFLPLLGVRGPFDEVTRSLIFHPTIDLFRWAMEPVDPFGLAPYLVTDRAAAGPAPDVLIQLASLDEIAATTASQSMVAAAGIPTSGELVHAVTPPATLPAAANVDTPSGAITAVAVQFDPGAHGMLEVATRSPATSPRTFLRSRSGSPRSPSRIPSPKCTPRSSTSSALASRPAAPRSAERLRPALQVPGRLHLDPGALR